MGRLKQHILGVSLLEMMLVLAIIAMIVVMSIRYYQSASVSQQANAVLQQLQAISTAADSLAQAKGSYADAPVSTATLEPLLADGAKTFTTPWGGAISLSQVEAKSYGVTVEDTPLDACALIVAKLKTNNHYTQISPADCTTSGADVSYTYIANP